MPSGRRGSGHENCIPLYFIHFSKTTDPVRHQFSRLDPFLLCFVCREHGISEQTLYRWKRKYAGMDVHDAKRLKELEEENRRAEEACGRKRPAHRRAQGGELKKW